MKDKELLMLDIIITAINFKLECRKINFNKMKKENKYKIN